MSIEIRNIRKSFGDFVALDDVNFKVETGELIADSRSLVAAGRNVAIRSIPASKPPSSLTSTSDTVRISASLIESISAGAAPLTCQIFRTSP